MSGLCKRAKGKQTDFHALRRFVASILADSGKSTNAIRRALRHKNVSITERYIQNVNNDVKETMDALSFEKVFGVDPEDEQKKSFPHEHHTFLMWKTIIPYQLLNCW
jgi:hypothetical protein